MLLKDIRDVVAAATLGCWDQKATIGAIATSYLGENRLVDGKMTDIARSEFLSKIGVPTSYHSKPFFDKLEPDTQRGVVRDCVVANGLYDKPVLSRWTGRTLRAVVSNYYTCVPHLSVVEALMGSDTPFDVVGFWPKDFTAEAKAMHLRLTTPTIHSLNGNGDVGRTMIHVSNSEVGRGALILDVGIFRLVCTNGLIARIGGALLLKERHIYKEPAELIDSFNDAVAQAEEVATGFVHVLERARTQQVPMVSLERTLDALPSVRMRRAVREAMEGDTLFDLYNAATSVAQDYTHEAQFAWERWARSLLDRDWSEHIHAEGEYCPECGRSI